MLLKSLDVEKGFGYGSQGIVRGILYKDRDVSRVYPANMDPFESFGKDPNRVRDDPDDDPTRVQ